MRKTAKSDGIEYLAYTARNGLYKGHCQIAGQYIGKNAAHGVEHGIEQTFDNDADAILEQVDDLHDPSYNGYVLEGIGHFAESTAEPASHLSAELPNLMRPS